jgi:TRAP-type mannitol/chloroaromatic compound transport system permease small subunit
MEENDLIEIKTSLLTLEGINEVILNTEIFRGNLQYIRTRLFH